MSNEVKKLLVLTGALASWCSCSAGDGEPTPGPELGAITAGGAAIAGTADAGSTDVTDPEPRMGIVEPPEQDVQDAPAPREGAWPTSGAALAHGPTYTLAVRVGTPSALTASPSYRVSLGRPTMETQR